MGFLTLGILAQHSMALETSTIKMTAMTSAIILYRVVTPFEISLLTLG